MVWNAAEITKLVSFDLRQRIEHAAADLYKSRATILAATPVVER